MGIPVSGKNLFPSNIQGLPTWYTIRVSKDGYLARREEHEIVVAMNPATFVEDLADVLPGGVFFYADDIHSPINGQDIVAYPMPVKQLTKDSGASSELRSYVANMVFVGVLSQMLGIDMDMMYEALSFHFKGRTKPIDLNFGVVQAAAAWAANISRKAIHTGSSLWMRRMTISWQMEILLLQWDLSMAECSSSPGIRLPRHPACRNWRFLAYVTQRPGGAREKYFCGSPGGRRVGGDRYDRWRWLVRIAGYDFHFRPGSQLDD